jgi:hypothetical protein
MRTLGTGLLILSLLITAIPLRTQDSKSSNTGAVLLDKCGEVVKSGDSPAYKPDSSKAFWCMGYLEGIMNLMSVLRMVYAPLTPNLPATKTSDQ